MNESDLYGLFETYPVQDGYSHPAVEIINEMDSLEVWNLIFSDFKFSADVLKCVGRLDKPFTYTWRLDLIERALFEDDTEIRDNAIQSIENWKGDDLFKILVEHVKYAESVPWLRQYAEAVLKDYHKDY